MFNIEVVMVEDSSTLEDVLEHLEEITNDGSTLSIDTETDGSTPQFASLFGIGLAASKDQAFYIPFRAPDRTPLLGEKEKARIVNFLVNTSAKIIGHNFVYDIIVLKNNLGIDLTNKLHCDTILLKHIVDEERPHGLKETAVKYLGPWASLAQEELYASIETNGGSTTKENLEMWKASTDVLGRYCGWDVCLTYQLYNKLSQKLEQEPGAVDLFYNDEIMPLYKEVTIPMTEKGFPIDVEHLKALQQKIQKEIMDLESKLYYELREMLEEREEATLIKKVPVKTAGKFPVYLAQVIGVELPIKNDKVTLASKALKQVLGDTHPFVRWMDGDSSIYGPDSLLEAQKLMYFDKYPDKRFIFNFKSPNDLKWLFFEKLGEKPISETDTGEPQVDDNFIETLSYPWIQDLLDFKRLIKLESTYITGILDIQVEGVVYPSWMQFGTTSGRYSCSGPNLQQIPRIREDESDEISERVKKYFNQIKAAFVAPPGYKIVNADYSQLEPCAFACASGDTKLQESFRKGYDLYSSIAIEAFGLHEYSADKKAPNYLGKHKKEVRQVAKVIALATVYGAGAGRLSSVLKTSKQEAQQIIDDYLNAYPQLRNYMESCDRQVLTQGKVKSRFGRVRHLDEAKQLYKIYGQDILNEEKCRKNKNLKDLYWKLKGLLNLAKNHPIQSTAAYIVNKASLAMARELKAKGIDAYVASQVHDEICCIAKEESAEKVKELLKKSMESTTIIEVPLRAEPLIGNNWAEAK